MTRNATVRFPLFCAMAVLCASQFGCGSHDNRPTYSQFRFPALSPNMARIFFYDGDSGKGEPAGTVAINDEVVGSGTPGTFFFVDRAPGKCVVSCRSMWPEQAAEFIAVSGKTYYVSIYAHRWGMGELSGLLVDQPTAMKDMPNCVYEGPPLSGQ